MSARTWNGRDHDHGAVHALGNGRLLVYAQGPDLIQVVGPPYSSPVGSAFQFPHLPGATVSSRRRPLAAIWDHVWEQDGQELATWSDTVDPVAAVYVRRIRTRVPMALTVIARNEVAVIADRTRLTAMGFDEGFLIVLLSGKILLDLPGMFRVHQQIALRGQARFVPSGATTKELGRIEIEPGECDLIIAAGSDFPASQESLATVHRLGVEAVFQRSAAHWAAFAAPRRAVVERLPDDPFGAAVSAAIEDVAVLIKTQQGREGGVLAGHFYHTSYVRDSYGAGRGLLALGHHDEARAILDYYADLFARAGMLGNSQTVGGPAQFQRNEHDDAEGPATVIMQIFDVAEAVREPDLPRRFLPLIDWGWQAMTDLLVDHMMPFSGDETYMAGKVLSRDVVEHGSAEATMLFIHAGARLLPWLRRHGLWDARRLDQAERTVAACRAAFRGHFIRGQLFTNQPAREAQVTPTASRRGFCMDCWQRGDWSIMTYGQHLRSPEGRYLCPACLARDDRLPRLAVAPQVIHSVALVAPFLGVDLVRPEELRLSAEKLLTSLDNKTNERLVGYDAGLLLTALDALGHPRARIAAQALLDLRDQTGAWVEYYEAGKPWGCRARPWESGVNIAALISHAGRSARKR